MGVGLSEYRAAIGTFAAFAQRGRTKPKLQKAAKQGVEKNEQLEEKLDTNQLEGKCVSLDRWKTRSRSRNSGYRRKTSSFNRHDSRSKVFPLRSRSKSATRKRDSFENTAKAFREACTACKTKLLYEKWDRGRTKTRRTQTRQSKCCALEWKKSGDVESSIDTTSLHLLTCVAVSECISLEYAMSSIVLMLLVLSGIETNPGPPATCCSASQHFRRVNDTIRSAQQKFQSKITQNTLTQKIIEVDVAGTFELRLLLDAIDR